MNNTDQFNQNTLFLSLSDTLSAQTQAQYHSKALQQTLDAVLAVMGDKLHHGLDFAYFNDAQSYWHKPKTLDIYITDSHEARAINLEARGKDYATNVLSYPSELPYELLDEMDEIPLGELILCHEVVSKEADEQGKSFEHHLTHLIVHGILHLLGFDHEISDADADEMEGFEIEILARLGIANPYL